MKQQTMATLAACILAASFAAWSSPPRSSDRAGADAALLMPDDEGCGAAPLLPPLPPDAVCTIPGRFALDHRRG
ncbi:MAG TPA: hypothetical protein VGM74_20755 [Burkholderiaceae bacterium]|jgi:hypothetical protein